MGTYETASGRGVGRGSVYPESWGRPVGSSHSTARKEWVLRNITRNPRFKLEQLAARDLHRIRAEIAEIDAQLKAMGIEPPSDLP
ncbi:hypothetical protein PROP_03142 [Propionicimonas sp. T2.31MG-18]|uniref:hypothetical protein n=1 Tax=Propionicimonas sp. T2.31MG-18 TaxID=3157620 RepID=UPI0035E9F24D